MTGSQPFNELRGSVAGLTEAADTIADCSTDSEALDGVPCGVLHELNDADNGLRVLAAFLEADDPAVFLAKEIDSAWRLLELGYGLSRS